MSDVAYDPDGLDENDWEPDAEGIMELLDEPAKVPKTWPIIGREIQNNWYTELAVSM